MSADREGVFSFGEPHCKFVSYLIGLIRRYLSRLEGLPDLICDYLFCPDIPDIIVVLLGR